MSLLFYPDGNLDITPSITEKIDIFYDAAQHFKSKVLGARGENTAVRAGSVVTAKADLLPIHIQHAINWGALSKLLNEIRNLPEATHEARTVKAAFLDKLSEVYEVLRAAKMVRLEAVRLALANEAKLLRQA